MEPLSKELAELLDRPNFADLSTLMPDGAPHSDPVWVLRDGNTMYVGTGETTLKAKNTRRDPRIALSIVDRENPYEEAQLRGRVVEHREDNDMKIMDRISHKYTGKDFPFGRGGPGRVALVIEIERARYLKLPF
jgi:PPOX class probable F420-dependent enzyme